MYVITREKVKHEKKERKEKHSIWSDSILQKHNSNYYQALKTFTRHRREKFYEELEEKNSKNEKEKENSAS